MYFRFVLKTVRRKGISDLIWSGRIFFLFQFVSEKQPVENENKSTSQLERAERWLDEPPGLILTRFFDCQLTKRNNLSTAIGAACWRGSLNWDRQENETKRKKLRYVTRSTEQLQRWGYILTTCREWVCFGAGRWSNDAVSLCFPSYYMSLR